MGRNVLVMKNHISHEPNLHFSKTGCWPDQKRQHWEPHKEMFFKFSFFRQKKLCDNIDKSENFRVLIKTNKYYNHYFSKFIKGKKNPENL